MTKQQADAIKAQVAALREDLRAERPSGQEWKDWTNNTYRVHYSYGVRLWGKGYEAQKRINRYLARLFGSKSRAYSYAPYMRKAGWCTTVLNALEYAYLQGAKDALEREANG